MNKAFYQIEQTSEKMIELNEWLQDQVNSETGEISDETYFEYEIRLEALLRNEHNLIDGICLDYRESEETAKKFKALAKGYADQGKKIEKRNVRYKEMLKRILDGEEFNGELFTIKTTKSQQCNVNELQESINGFEIDLTDILTKNLDASLEEIENLYKIIKIKFEVSISEAKKLIKSGACISGCNLEHHKNIKITLKK